MMKPFLVPAFVALFVGAAHAQEAKPLSVKQVPLRADAPILFAPRGWKIEKRVNGNLNRDKIADAALVLIEDKPAKTSEGDATERLRALVVLLREGKGWRRVGFSGVILRGTRDGGAFYGAMETPVDVAIARGVVLLSMEAGSREVETTTHRLRFEPKRGGVFLIGFDSNTRDRLTGGGTNISANFLTGQQKTTTFASGTSSGKTKTARVSRKLRSLDSLREEDRYSG